MRTLCACLVLAIAAAGQDRTSEGQSLFTANCATCHGGLGDGGSGPDLVNLAWQATVTDDYLERVIRAGIPGSSMPSFGSRISEAGRRALVSHLRALAKTAIQPATNVTVKPVRVEARRLLAAAEDAGNWLMYGRDYANLRFSPLGQINRSNIQNLVPVWSFQTGVPDGLEATPLFADGVLYLTTSWNHIFAIDARTGAELWHHKRRLPERMSYCCGPANRGVAIVNGTLYMTTLDAHLVALDAATGRVRWDRELGKVADNLNAKQPPLIIGNKVVAGIAGGDSPSRGFIDAYDSESGERLWRFYTVGESPAASWQGESHKTGGGATWLNGSYDPDLNLIYWGTGNPYPDFDGDARAGDNLYTDSVIALEAETGRLKWHYQYTPHDVWDYDGVNENLLVDLNYGGSRVKALVHADRNGYIYALDRTNGRFLYAKPFVRVTWAKGFDAQGKPILNPEAVPTPEGVTVCPGAAGGKEWNAMAWSPLTRLVYIPAIENCAKFFNHGIKARQMNLPPGPSGFQYLPNQAYGKMMAVQADTGSIAWEVRTRTPLGGGVLATAGGLVLTGDAEGNFTAYGDDDGRILWSYQTGSGMRAAPITYLLDGRQYIAIPSGMGGAVGGYTGAGAPWMKNYRSGDTLYVFALFKPGASEAFHGGARP